MSSSRERRKIRLTYVYSRRKDFPIKRGHVISVITRCIGLATSGVEDEDDPWEGYLYEMWNSLGGDVETLQEVLTETEYTAEVPAILLIVQRVRFTPNEKVRSGKPPKRPNQVLAHWSNMIGEAFSECDIEEPSSDAVRNVLESYRVFSKQEIEELLEVPRKW